jgi:hypothetical protein
MYRSPDLGLKPKHAAPDHIAGVAFEPLLMTWASAELIRLPIVLPTHVWLTSGIFIRKTGTIAGDCDITVV